MKMSFSISVYLDDVGDIDNFNISSDIESEDNNLTDMSLLNDFQVENVKELISFIQGDNDDDLDEDWSSPSLIFGMFTGEEPPKEDTSVTDEADEEQPSEVVAPNEPVTEESVTETTPETKD